MTEKFTTKTRNTIVDWNNLCRDVAVTKFDKRKKMVGPGQIVQFDESLFQGKRKYNRGRLRNGDIIPNVDDNLSSDADDIDDDHSTQKNYGTRIQGPWIFGMCCKNVDGVLERRFFKVEKRDKATLIPIIQNEIELGSIIYSDQWQAYSTLNYIGYHRETVNHSEFFVDPTTGEQTQTIKRSSVYGDMSKLNMKLKPEEQPIC